MFYFKSISEYQNYLSRVLIVNDEYHDLIMEIFNIFMEWNVFDKYNLGELRGNYLETLLFNYIQKEYGENNLYKETNILLDNYKSHTWDVLLILPDLCYLYECKFSSKILKRKHIDLMIALSNKLPSSKIFLVSYENKDVINDSILNLRGNTDKIKYEKIINNINLISIENFNNQLFVY